MRRTLLLLLSSVIAFCVFTMTMGSAMDHAWKGTPTTYTYSR